MARTDLPRAARQISPHKPGKRATDAFDVSHLPPDRGCTVSPRCIVCPLPICKDELPKMTPRMIRVALETAALVNGGVPVAKVARQQCVSPQVVYYRLARAEEIKRAVANASPCRVQHME